MFKGAAGNAYPVTPMYENIHEFTENWEDSWPINCYFPLDPMLVAQSILTGMAMMVSDRSYNSLLFTKIGGVAWILECSQTGASCCGDCSTYGLQMNSMLTVWNFRAAMPDFLAFLMTFAIYHQLQGGSITFHFDNDAGLDKLVEAHIKVPTCYKHADLVRAIQVIVF